tara:strand:- start:4923 stop:5861 length:939 start_codon:yes stop_codon:yes gene_type:complete
MFRIRNIIALFIASVFLAQLAKAQHPSFESTLKTHKPWALTFSGGVNGFFKGNEAWDVNVPFAVTSQGQQTSLIEGTWTPNNKLGWMAGLGCQYVIDDPILIDRLSFNFIGAKRNMSENFYGSFREEADTNANFYADTTLAVSRHAINIGASLTAYNSLTISPDLFIESGLGISYKRDFFAQTILDTTGYPFQGEPQIHTLSLEATIGVGVMIWKGRFLRMHLTTDLLQFIKDENHVNSRNGASTFLWTMQDYRPYRIVLNYDLFLRVKGKKNCANPKHTEEAKELFSSEMRGYRKAKKNNKKKKKRRKDIY